MKLKQVVGDNIRFIREKRGWSQDELAVVAKMSKTFIGDVERAEKIMSLESLEKVAKALKVTPAVLVTPNAYKDIH